MVDENGQQIPGCYGSQVSSGNQSLYQPLSLCEAGENHILVTDYRQHRIHLVTHQLQFVRHLVAKGQQADSSDDEGMTSPRHVCLHAGLLYVGTKSGRISIHRVQDNQL